MPGRRTYEARAAAWSQRPAARPVGGRIDAKLDQIELLADAAQLGP